MKISIIAGSHRRESESLRVAQYIQGVLGGSVLTTRTFCHFPTIRCRCGMRAHGATTEMGGLMDPDCRGVEKLRRFRNRLPRVVGNGPGRAEELLFAVWR